MQEIFLKSLKGPLVDLLGLKKEAAVSALIGPMQDPFRYRVKYFGMRVAGLLLDEKGELRWDRLELLDKRLCLLGRESDELIFTHLQKCIKNLKERKEIEQMLKKFSPPLCHKGAVALIQETLWPEKIHKIEAVHIRKAVLAAWLTSLRQATGSCFATAPAMWIQQEAPLLFFKDMLDLLSLGQMKRVIGGKEYAVPLQTKMLGDLRKKVTAPFFGLEVAQEAAGIQIKEPFEEQTVEAYLRKALLKEMGLHEEDLKEEAALERMQGAMGGVHAYSPRAKKVAEWKNRLEKAYEAFKAITECALLRAWEYSLAGFCDVKTEFARWNLYVGLGLHPDEKGGIGFCLREQIQERLDKGQKELESLAQDYEREAGNIRALEVMLEGALSDMRRSQLKSEWMSHAIAVDAVVERRNRLVNQMDRLTQFFPWLIQEYSEKVQEYFQEIFDPELQGERDAIDDSPAGFRLSFKHGRSDASQWSAIYTQEQYVSALREFFTSMEQVLVLPSYVEKEWMEEITSALVQFIGTDEFIETAIARSNAQGRLSPWDYISGGTLQTLWMAYNSRTRPFKEASIVPHSAEELLFFLAGFEGQGPWLMHSPTHAFLFYPEWLQGQKKIPALRKQVWTQEMQEYLAQELSRQVPDEALFLHRIRQANVETNEQFREVLIQAMQGKEAIVDAFLYEQGILLDATEATEALRRITGREVPALQGTFFGSNQLFSLAQTILLQTIESALSERDWNGWIADQMQALGLLQKALLFADTNWSDWVFGFVRHPVSKELELWRLNKTANRGIPMTAWKEFLSKENTAPWVVLKDPSEYTN